MLVAVALRLVLLGVPLDVAAASVLAAHRHGLDPVVVGGYLLSEHPGGRWSGACSSTGACGPYQLAATWPLRYGYELDDRLDPWRGADMLVRAILYSRRRHERCEPGHDWRAHLKAAPGHRGEVAGAVRRWVDAEEGLRFFS